jgi:phosphopantetheine adenylyltransferase
MDMKKRRKGDTDQLAARLAPLEEQNKPAAEHQLGSPLNEATGQSNRQFGEIIVDSEDLQVSTDIIETREEKQFFGIEPVVLVVLIVMLGFIGFITWQISTMPPR